MAAPKHLPEREALIKKAVEEIAAINPQIHAPSMPYSDEEYETLRAQWEHYDSEIAQQLGQYPDATEYLASDAVNDDRGK